MKLKELDYYICPKCNFSNFELGKEKKNEGNIILEGQLLCGDCGVSFPIINGVPRFVTNENYAGSFGFQWRIHAKTQLDSYTGLPISKDRLFRVTDWPERMEGQVILEVGSGAGRFTEVLLKTGADVFSFDYSSAVDVNYLSNGHCSNLILFQGDIYNIPLRKYSFDKVICLGVIQHTPDPEKAFKILCKYIREGGEIVIDVYSKRLSSLLHWKYLLRPLTKMLDKRLLYKIIESLVPILLPLTIIFHRFGGRLGARLLPIADYSYLRLPYELNKQWSILDTFDMFAPEYDIPQTRKAVYAWFREAGLVDIMVKYGPNGIIGRARRPQQK